MDAYPCQPHRKITNASTQDQRAGIVFRPLGQLLLFVVGGSVIMSAITIALAFLLRGTRDDMDLVQITLVLLPQVLIDGITLGFVYATIALGYTMVYGVLEFINFAHGEIFMFGAFAGVELMIYHGEPGLHGGCQRLQRLSLRVALRLDRHGRRRSAGGRH